MDLVKEKSSLDEEEGACNGWVIEQLSPEEDRRILRKIDLCLLPMMALTYTLQYLDKSTLSFTAILGLRQDLSLNGAQYSWSNGIYYFGYMLASYPVVLLMVRFAVGKTTATSALVWGAVLIFTALCRNPAGLFADRFFLGAVEAAVAPGLCIVISTWYKRSEQPARQTTIG